MSEELEKSEVVEPSSVKQLRRRKAATETPTKVGMSSNIAEVTKRNLMLKVLERKQILTIPDFIKQKNPDKFFVWVNYNRLQQQGMWHPNGYTLYHTAEEDKNDNQKKTFGANADDLVHRNEMVLAYLPKEEYERRKQENEILNGTRDATEIITNDPNLRGFSPHANVQKDFVSSNEDEG